MNNDDNVENIPIKENNTSERDFGESESVEKNSVYLDENSRGNIT
jgi:hypothetical protein